MAEAARPAEAVATQFQAVAVGVADGDQVSAVRVFAEVVEARLFAGLGKDQFGWVAAEVDGGARQSVGDRRALGVRDREAGPAVLVIGPYQLVAVAIEAMGEGMAPAEAQTIVDFRRAGAVQARPGETQRTV